MDILPKTVKMKDKKDKKEVAKEEVIEEDNNLVSDVITVKDSDISPKIVKEENKEVLNATNVVVKVILPENVHLKTEF